MANRDVSMAWSLVRMNISRQCKLLCNETKGCTIGGSLAFRGALGAGNVTTQVAFISSKRVREEMGIKRPPPFPYDRKKYGILRSLFDSTIARFDDNTKIVVVDGNIAAGKTSFARKLAEELDMRYVHEPDVGQKYINAYGYDLRMMDPELPESAKSFDLKKFYKNPNHENAAAFQFDMFVIRFEFYVDSLCHLLNTGKTLFIKVVWCKGIQGGYFVSNRGCSR